MTVTPNRGFTLPTVGADFGSWGTELNGNFSILDLNLSGAYAANVAGNSNITVTATQAQNLVQQLSGVLTGNISYMLPAQRGFWIIANGTSGAYQVVASSAGGGASLTVPQGASQLVWSDGVGIFLPTPASTTPGQNLLHNPLFTVQQRGAGPWTGGVTADQWYFGTVGDTSAASIVTLGDSDRTAIGDESAISAYRVAVAGTSGASAMTLFFQPVENVRRLSGQTATVSFWAVASAPMKMGISWDQNFGTGGSPSTPVLTNSAVANLTTTWTRYSTTCIFSSATGKTFGSNGNDYTQLNCWLSSGSNNNVRAGSIGVQTGTVTVWGAKLEIGPTMTALQKLDPVEQLAQCQRFYQTMHVDLWGYGLGTQSFSQKFSLPVTMRATPVYSVVLAGTPSNCGAFSYDQFSVDSFRANALVTTTGGAYYINAIVGLSAEF